MGGMWFWGNCGGSCCDKGGRLRRRSRRIARAREKADTRNWHSEFGDGFTLEQLPKDYDRRG